jgi:GDP-4-dehydro-6-deoxy-D-mannose reductase
MKVLILGADGFVGRGIAAEASRRHEVFASTRKQDEYNVDLTDQDAVESLLRKTNPEIIVNAAGIVENSERSMLNVTFTSNILHAALEIGLKPKLIICSSAGLYGHVNEDDLPVPETLPTNPIGQYATSKKIEEETALQFGKENSITVLAARLFNPIGPGMHERFLITNILHQINQIKHSEREHIEISRLDSRRDYIDLRDIARAVVSLFEVEANDRVYNIGSGRATNNATILNLLLASEGLPIDTPVKETSELPEQTVACQADIRRISAATGWSPKYSLEETIQGVIDASKK